MKGNNHIVIMAGGIGSRLWPMSTSDFPKQFIDVLGVGKSLLQLTVERFLPICDINNFWIVTGSRYADIVREQLPNIPKQNILLEPEPRNTAPCIAYACWKIMLRHPNANIVVSPSDAMVIDIAEYRRIISAALLFTSDKRAIVTVGIKPSRPETGYGYINMGDEVEGLIHKVKAFKEKPDIETAKHYVANGNYCWNAGIFVWNAKTIIDEFQCHSPLLAQQMDEMSKDFYTDREKATVNKLFPLCQKISIDYAVMEKSENIYTIPADFGWSDLGSWGALHSILPHDANDNAFIVAGEKVIHDCNGCIVHVPELSRVVVDGLKDCIVAFKNNSLLICRLKEEQRIKDF